MKLIFRYIGKYKRFIFLTVLIKLLGTSAELALPYILEHIIDNVVPLGRMSSVIVWGLAMFVAAILCRWLNVSSNRKAVDTAHRISYEVRQSLFERTSNLTGAQFDAFGLPSLISRMTSDSYNVQSSIQQIQTLCVRAPIMLIGGIIVTLTMNAYLASILILMLPLLMGVILFVSSHGIPLYTTVQQSLDTVVRLMRENITGIRVVKALSKESYEKKRFAEANRNMAHRDIIAATVMSIPWPLMQLFLNIGLTLVVFLGARRVNEGLMKPGVILAFLTYFNMITMGIMGVNRIFMTMSKASASADRIDAVLQAPIEDAPLDPEKAAAPAGDEFIRFEHVDFSYGEDSSEKEGFVGEEREKALADISFAIRRGESLGIIGPTGCGKTTIINLLMHFYDADAGGVFVDGKDVRTYEKDKLRSKFGAAFQNDMIFQDTLLENIDFGRHLSAEQIRRAVEDAQAAEFIDSLPAGLSHEASIKGANLSGGQKQRILVSRALAGDRRS